MPVRIVCTSRIFPLASLIITATEINTTLTHFEIFIKFNSTVRSWSVIMNLFGASTKTVLGTPFHQGSIGNRTAESETKAAIVPNTVGQEGGGGAANYHDLQLRLFEKPICENETEWDLLLWMMKLCHKFQTFHSLYA
jgi:hypothetical protein